MSLVRLGHIDLSFHAASAAVVQRLLERAGHEVVTSAEPHEAMFRSYGARAVDMLVSAWLPGSHGAYLAPYAADTHMLGVLYEPYCIWGVPDYVPESEVATVQDLKRPDVARRMEKLIQGINPGAGISRFSVEIVREYQLDAEGYHFETGPEESCYHRFEEAVERKAWVVVPLWLPQFLHARHRIRELDEPLGLLRGRDQATLIARHACTRQFSPDLIEALTSLTLGNASVSQLDYLICREGMTPLEAADIWLKSA
ncbi:glycine betaine ABC transporter substrate-binding protein [Paraburkholderia silviterrae]|uniref:Glycine/betaine ABC transporter substrate-binding protein n=1 Tax=Paraburkholderia silviterrae TaxID=2528715 RepID=A0A4R5M8F6_9BURK|nr:glycine betaine ABC transporter substrate-binding protein [Paraburkholderia silviterrae]TDG22772.1 glycine/betaine ABC transporter substrate-binding protein [Paraburkholderia silviterrae]